jgi:hypothetical protein
LPVYVPTGVALRPDGGLLFVYGPFTRDRVHTTESNAAFDASLRARNPEWGYRDLGDMRSWAAEAGLVGAGGVCGSLGGGMVWRVAERMAGQVGGCAQGWVGKGVGGFAGNRSQGKAPDD